MTLNSFWTLSKDAQRCGRGRRRSSGITWYNRRLEKGRAGYDINHRWVTTMTYELPVGKGKQFMNIGRMEKCVFGGWELVGSQHFQIGPADDGYLCG